MKRSMFALVVIVSAVVDAKKPVGLPGSHNVCYQNAAIQCLYAIPELTSFLLDQGGCNLYKKDTVSQAYCTLIHEMATSREKKLSEMKFCDVAWSKLNLPKGQQSDAPRFASALIKHLVEIDFDLGTCIKYEKLCKYPKDLFLAKTHIMRQCPDCQEETSKDEFLYSYVLMPEGIKEFENALQSAQSPKIFEQGLCSCDQNLHKVIKQIQFVHLPFIFVINLYVEGAKPSIRSFPLRLELTYHELSRAFVKIDYELVGCIIYSGDYQVFGHYQACVKDMESKKWYLCNNTMITELSDNVMTKFSQTCDLDGSYPLTFFYRQITRKRITSIQDDLKALANDLTALAGVLKI